MPELPPEMTPGDEPEAVDPSYLDVVERLVDGAPVDWGTALGATPGREDAERQLRRLESVLAGHREVIQSAANEPEHEPTLFMWGPLAVREKLGEGTFGEVFRAWDAGVGREVALKLRKAPASARGTRRWLDEARKLARVRHPNVLVVYGADEHDERAGIWTELLHGRTLEAVLVRNGPLGAREAALIGADLCSALAAVHSAGLVHGDIKTTNIMREGTSLGETPSQTPSRAPATVEAGRIVLMDFGTAFDHAEVSQDPASRLYATPLTAAPEVLDGRDAGPTSDLYSLGVVLYRLVTERYPIEARSLEELRHLAKQGQRTPLRAARPDLPAPFVDVIERALSADPAARFGSAAEMERALSASLGAGGVATTYRASAPSRSVRRVWIGAGAALLAMAAFTTFRVLLPRVRESHGHVSQATSAPLAATMVRTFSGTEEFGNFAMSTASADLNYDGYADWITGAPHGHAQHAYVFFGGPDADNAPDITLTPKGESNQYGRWVCTGDVNGDKLVDLLVSETQGETDRGRVFVYLGAKPFDAQPDLVFTGERNYDHFGVWVVTLDFNHDGFDDTAISSYFHDETRGRVYVYFGGATPDDTPDLIYSGENKGDAYGNCLGVGDLNHDGTDDLAVTAYWNDSAGFDAGRVYLYYGAKTPPTSADVIFDGRTSGDNFGDIAWASSDYSGDGIDDLLVASFRDGTAGYQAGAVYGFRGGVTMSTTPDLTLLGEAASDRFGSGVCAGDLDGDGAAEVIVQANSFDFNGDDAGRVYIFRGGKQLDNVADLMLSGKNKGDFFGISTLPVRDTGGGVPALLIGAHTSDTPLKDAGQAYLYTFSSR